jgi:hypothetical protein
MQTIINSPVFSSIAGVAVALAFYLWKYLDSYLQSRTPQNVQSLLDRLIPALVEAAEKVKAYQSGPQKLDFVFAQLDQIAKAYHVDFPPSVARALIEQHVLSLPHTGMSKVTPAKNQYPANTTNPVPAL